MNEMTDTWQIHNRINSYLLDAIDEAQLNAPQKGRTVGEQFAHLHNVRLMWLKVAAPEMMEGLEKLEKGTLDRKTLSAALSASAEAISKLLEQGVTTGKIKGFKPHPTAFLGYLVSHESHHRGQIVQQLKAAGHPVDKKILYGMWEWGVR